MNFKKYEKELNKAGYIISGDMVSNSRGDVVGQMDPYGEFHYSDDVMAKVICDAMRAEEDKPVKKEVKKVVKKYVRTRDEDGQYVADDLETLDINEAWTEVK
tara:strand:- start:59 stop:364 length:306 start_codon:yes stop_codon:yes gene_type:complete